MKPWALLWILSFVFTSYISHAQSQDKRRTRDKLSNKVIASDSTLIRSTRIIADTLSPHKISKKIQAKSDSVENKLGQTRSNIDTLLNVRYDSLNIANPLNTLQQQIQAASDSLQKRLGSEVNSTTDKVDSQIKSVTTQAKSKVGAIQDKVETKVDGVTKSVDDKVKGVTDKIPDTDKLNLPNADLQKSVPELDKTTQGLNDLKVPELKTDVPNANVPSLDTDLKKQLPEIKTPELKLPEVNDIDKVKDVSNEATKVTGELDKVGNEVDRYSKELEKVKTDIPNQEEAAKQAEDKAAEMANIKSMEAEKAKLTAEQARYEAMIQKYRDKKMLSEEIKRKSMAIANEQLSQNAAKVKEAQKIVTKSKKGLSGIKSVKDVFRKKSTELDGKKLYQRLVPGVTWQVYNKEFVSIDLGLQTGYRISPRFTAGLGFVYRIGADKQFDSFIKGLNTYGGRIYADLAIAKGVFAHGEYELLNVDAAIQPITTDPINTTVSGSYFGLGKRFKISRNFRGNIIGLYRVEYKGELPSVNKITARFGVEYVFRKPKKKLVIPKIK